MIDTEVVVHEKYIHHTTSDGLKLITQHYFSDPQITVSRGVRMGLQCGSVLSLQVTPCGKSELCGRLRPRIRPAHSNVPHHSFARPGPSSSTKVPDRLQIWTRQLWGTPTGFREGISFIKNMLLWPNDNYKYYTVKRHNFSKSHGSFTDSGFLFFLQPGGVGGVWNSISHVAAAGLLWRSKCVAFLRAWGRPKLCWSVLLANHLEVKNGSAALPSTKHLQIQFFGIWLDYGIMISKKHI